MGSPPNTPLAPNAAVSAASWIWATLQRSPAPAKTGPVTSSAVSADVDETDLMRRIGSGDAQAYRAIADRYFPKVFRFATRVLGDGNEAEDITQETFLRLWQHAHTWTPRAKLSTWLHQIAKNLCLDRLRRKRPASAEVLDALPGSLNPASLFQQKRLAERVQLAMNSLPARQRMALTLVHYEGVSQRQAADILEIKLDALESLLARGRRKLKSELTGLLPNDTPEEVSS
jgi:RNA polymerase sigma-70 factor, ECF subfamily